MSVLWGVLIVVVAVVWLVTVADLVRRHLGTKRTVAWLLIVLILPLLGSALYWVLRGPETKTWGETPGGG
jgi:membrane associated rhomboid family serine protease